MCSPFTKRMVFLRRRNEDLLAQLETNSVILEERLKKLHETAKAPIQSQNKLKKRKSKVWKQRNSSGQVSAALCPDLPRNPSEESSNPEAGAIDFISEPLVAKESTVMSPSLQPQKVTIPSRRKTMPAFEQKHTPECYGNTIRTTRNEKRKRACIKTCPLCSCLEESDDPFRDLDLRKKTLETARAMIVYSPQSTFLRSLKARSHIDLNNQGATKPIAKCICFLTQPSSESSDSAEINQSTDLKKSKSSILSTRISPLKTPSVNVSKCPIIKQRTRFSKNLSDTDESRLTKPNSRKASNKMLCSNISKHSEPRSRSSGMTPYHALSHARCSATSKSSQLKMSTCYHSKNAPAVNRRRKHRTSSADTDRADTDEGSPSVSMCRCSKHSSRKKATSSRKGSRVITSAVCGKRTRSCKCPHSQPQGYNVLAPLVENERDLGAAAGERQSRKTSQTTDLEREYRKISQTADLERNSRKESQAADFGEERELRKKSQIAESGSGKETRQVSTAADFGSSRRVDGTDVTEDDWVDKLSEFRRSNWFDTHAHQTSRDALGNCVTDSHECIHRYIVNDRLFATPVYADSQNRSRCMQCHLPRDIDTGPQTSRPTQQQPAQALAKDKTSGPPQRDNADAYLRSSQHYSKGEDIRPSQYNLPRKMDAQPPQQYGVPGEMGFKRAHREQIRVTLPQRVIPRSSDLESTEAGFHISGAASVTRETQRVAACMLQHAIKSRPAIPKPPKPAHSLALRFQKGMR